MYRDLGVIENRRQRLEAKKKRLPEEEKELELLARCQDFLMEERPLREMEFSDAEDRMVRGFAFLSRKPEMVVLNLDETQIENASIPEYEKFHALMELHGLPVVRVYGSMEMEMGELAPEEQQEFMADLGISEPGRDRLIAGAYGLLGLISFFTTGKDEVKSWTISRGDTAVDAAGAIHSDLARGFIRAQVVHYNDFIEAGATLGACREKGLLRLEGKEYLVQDGDMIEIRFNV